MGKRPLPESKVVHGGKRANPLTSREEGDPNFMAEYNSAGTERQMEPPASIEYPVVRKKFRITIDVEATLTGGPRGGELPPAPETLGSSGASTFALP